MPKLTDTQTILLSSAAQRSDGSLLPLPQTLSASAEVINKAIAALIKDGFAEEAPVTTPALTWRTDDDQRFGVASTDAGRIAIGIQPETTESSAAEPAGASVPTANANAARPTKATLVLSLLQREQGATLIELVEATGWLPHTARAALTGIRKKGHAIAKGKRDDVTCYTLAV